MTEATAWMADPEAVARFDNNASEAEFVERATCSVCGGIQSHLPDCGPMARERLALAEKAIENLQAIIDERD